MGIQSHTPLSRPCRTSRESRERNRTQDQTRRRCTGGRNLGVGSPSRRNRTSRRSVDTGASLTSPSVPSASVGWSVDACAGSQACSAPLADTSEPCRQSRPDPSIAPACLQTSRRTHTRPRSIVRRTSGSDASCCFRLQITEERRATSSAARGPVAGLLRTCQTCDSARTRSVNQVRPPTGPTSKSGKGANLLAVDRAARSEQR
jgi:hypothetical protein